MITVDQLPKKSVKAARLAMAIALANDGNGIPECIAAALNAWPKAKRVKGYFTHDTDYYEPAFILPLPEQENSDGK